jgi:hypothetical protein
MKYFVSRQVYWGVELEDQNTVEIASGGLNYANPDMLVAKYAGEGDEYTDPVKAVEVAFAIAEAWQKDKPELKINIAHGFTGGNTIPFEGCNKEELIEWAKKAHEKLPKCDQCGEILDEKSTYKLCDYPDYKFCSEYCAEQYYDQAQDPVEEEVA